MDIFIMWPFVVAALHPVRLSVRSSVPRLRFSRNRKSVKTFNLVKIYCWTRVTRGANLSNKGQRSRSLGTKMWNWISTHIFVKSGSI